jgi:hypothetical protein
MESSPRCGQETANNKSWRSVMNIMMRDPFRPRVDMVLL